MSILSILLPQTVRPHGPSIANWLTQQQSNDYSDTCNVDISVDDVVVVDLGDEGSPTGGYETTDSCCSGINVVREETADYFPRINDFAGWSVTRCSVIVHKSR